MNGALSLVLVVLLGLLAFLALRRLPRATITLWLLVIAFLPVWIGASIRGIFLPAASVLAVAAIVCLLLPPSPSGPRELVLTSADGLVLLLLGLGAAGLALGSRPVALASLVAVVTYWLVGYVLGRVVARSQDLTWVCTAVSMVLTVVALLAVVEFVTGFNPFVGLRADNRTFTTWSGIQTRGDLARSEGAFGHSIALGASLAMAIPLAFGSRVRPVGRLVMIGVLVAGTVATLSRVSILSAGAALLASIFFLRSDLGVRARAALAGFSVVAGAALVPPVSSVFAAAGNEATDSSAYRGNLLSLVPFMRPVGVSRAASTAPDGTLYFGRFRSIDSQLVLSGLTSGWLVVAAALALLLTAAITMVRGRATPAMVAVVTQAPVLASVALITQYAIFFWFVVGLAATARGAPARRPRLSPPADPRRETPSGPLPPRESLHS